MKTLAISFNNALGTYEAALKLRTQRAEVLASNLANTDTPNYKARDFDFHKALSMQLANSSGGRESTTHHRHLSSTSSAAAMNATEYRVPTQPSVDGNTVDEHLENAEFMANTLEHQTAFTLLNSRFKGLIRAIKGD